MCSALELAERRTHRASVYGNRRAETLRGGIDDFDIIAVGFSQHRDDLVRIAAAERDNVARFVPSFDEEPATQV